jgi:hypothetical protein
MPASFKKTATVLLSDDSLGHLGLRDLLNSSLPCKNTYSCSTRVYGLSLSMFDVIPLLVLIELYITSLIVLHHTTTYLKKFVHRLVVLLVQCHGRCDNDQL